MIYLKRRTQYIIEDFGNDLFQTENDSSDRRGGSCLSELVLSLIT